MKLTKMEIYINHEGYNAKIPERNNKIKNYTTTLVILPIDI